MRTRLAIAEKALKVLRSNPMNNFVLDVLEKRFEDVLPPNGGDDKKSCNNRLDTEIQNGKRVEGNCSTERIPR